MKWWQRALGLGLPDVVEDAANFTVSGDGLPGLLYSSATLDDYIRLTGRISRAEAMRVPAVKRAHDLICGVAGQFVLQVHDPSGKVDETFTPNLLQQPEEGVAPSITWTGVFADMLFDQRSWLQQTVSAWHGRPWYCQRLQADTVSVQPVYRHYKHGSALVWPEPAGMIRIDSPTTGLLAGSPAVRACIALERATLNAVDGVPPIGYFTPDENAGGEPFADADDVRDRLLDPWKAARLESSDGYVPYGVKYNIAGWDPEKLQLAEAREFAITEVARLTGLDAEDLSVSTTSRTYFNGQDRRRQRIEDVLGIYMTAIEGRLSMPDIVPRGYTVRFDTSNYLRLDDLAAAQADSLLVTSKILLPEEARTKRNLDPGLTPAETPDPEQVNSALQQIASIQQGHTPLALPAARELTR